MTDKKVKRVDLSKLSPEQREAFVRFYRDCQGFSPQMQEIRETSRALFNEFVRAPRWGINEGPGDGPQQDLWHVGAPEVNYVDHIERAQ